MAQAGEIPHSVAHEQAQGMLRAPSAARNIGPILQAVAPHMPPTGRGLEIASGTGEHAVALARTFPGITWQPTDIAAERLISIDAWRAERGAANMRLAQYLDAATPDWDIGRFDCVVTVNLLHLIAAGAAGAVIRGAARALAPGGVWFLYGPFRSGGEFRSDGDRAFHASLTASDPAIGYKDIEWVVEQMQAAGLVRAALVGMPANNLLVVARRQAPAD